MRTATMNNENDRTIVRLLAFVAAVLLGGLKGDRR